MGINYKKTVTKVTVFFQLWMLNTESGDDLNREDAYYFQLLLMAGFDDGYDAWLDGYLEREDPLSDIVLDLALCGSDVRQTIACLQSYCGLHDIDERMVCQKLRIFLRDTCRNGKMTQKELVCAMHRIADAHGDPGDFDFDLWGDMYYLDDIYASVQNGSIPREQFDNAFELFLEEGISLIGTEWHKE